MKSMKLVKVAYHRNGVMGMGFHVVAFRFRDGNADRRMVATVFGDDVEPGEVHPCTGHLSVLDADYAASGLITYPGNQWRGDDFEPKLRQWIAQWNEDEARKLLADTPMRVSGTQFVSANA